MMAHQEGMSALLVALMDRKLTAKVIDLDHYRIRGGMAVETDYIIRVEPTEGAQIESFTISKTYSSFRTLGNHLKKIADNAMATTKTVDESTKKLAQYCETVHHLVETQRLQYLGKVNYNYVKVLAKKRSQICQEILDASLSHFPTKIENNKISMQVAQTVETFFLLDHCSEVESENNPPHSTFFRVGGGTARYARDNEDESDTDSVKSNSKTRGGKNIFEDAVENVGNFIRKTIPLDSIPLTPRAGNAENSSPSLTSPVVPISRKTRKSVVLRQVDEDELKAVGVEASLLLDDERLHSELVPSYSHPVPNFQSWGTKIGDLLENNPIIFALIALASMVFLRSASTLTATMDLDILMLLIWAAFCIGLHTPRPMISGIDRHFGPPPSLSKRRPTIKTGEDRDGRKLLRMSLSTTPDATKAATAVTFDSIREEDDHDHILEVNQSPLPRFPPDAELGSKLNCWSQPTSTNFHVRGPNYLKDNVKIESADFVFPCRGIDLFLTDTCPENAGSNSGVMGGHLREVPTFIINFRLPWGVLLFYNEIPERFLPFVKAGYDPDFDKSKVPSMESFSNSDRCVARFLMASSEVKNKTLKIVPIVVQGPWVVKSVVGGKPAIIGNKLPVNYIYQKEEGNKALYLEADLDIVASSAARGILAAVRSYTQVLTLDLGFVVQGNKHDELPEQMLMGSRLHGIDPLSAPPLPASSQDIFTNLGPTNSATDDED